MMIVVAVVGEIIGTVTVMVVISEMMVTSGIHKESGNTMVTKTVIEITDK